MLEMEIFEEDNEDTKRKLVSIRTVDNIKPIDNADNFCQWLLEKFSFESETVMLAPATGFYSITDLGTDEVRIAYVLKIEDLKRAMKCLEEALKIYPGRKITEMAEFDFKIFVKHMDHLKIKEEFWWNLSTCQTEWIKQSTDLVLKTENLKFEFDIIKNMLSINSDLLHINSTSHEHYQQYFDEETKSIIAKAFEADVETYKYKF